LRVIESSRFGHIHLHVGCVTAFHRLSLYVCVLREFYMTSMQAGCLRFALIPDSTSRPCMA
ncbi:MAG: hypothetical protein J4G05_04965, partial [Chlorobi bacterium]|nr:hypothetical protein [Chlorobiota bacterium]